MAKQAKHERRDRSLESELKLQASAPEHARLRARLRELGAEDEGAYDEHNLRFEASPRRRAIRLRVLDGGPRAIITTKGPATFKGRIKTREETEVEVTDAHAAEDLILSLGYRLAFSYDKHRSTWRLGEVSVTLDVLDFGFFTELEGPPEVLEETARTLGLDPRQGLKVSYSAMARKLAQSPDGPPAAAAARRP